MILEPLFLTRGFQVSHKPFNICQVYVTCFQEAEDASKKVSERIIGALLHLQQHNVTSEISSSKENNCFNVIKRTSPSVTILYQWLPTP